MVGFRKYADATAIARLQLPEIHYVHMANIPLDDTLRNQLHGIGIGPESYERLRFSKGIAQVYGVQDPQDVWSIHNSHLYNYITAPLNKDHDGVVLLQEELPTEKKEDDAPVPKVFEVLMVDY